MKHEIIHLKEKYNFLGENGCDPTVEMFLPDNLAEMQRQNKKRPCMIVCPGGAYCFCSKREAEPIGVHFLPKGFNVFIMDYSVAPNKFPTQLREIAALIELIYENAEIWNCNTEKIAIIGFSAGGHLAAHYSNAFDCKEVREVFPESKPVNASLLCYPVITGDPEHSHKGSFINLSGKQELSEEDLKRFSCEKLVSDKTPPAFLWHTAEDDCVPVMNSILYASALDKYKIPFELHIYPFGPHGLSTADYLTNNEMTEKKIHASAWLLAAEKWLDLMDFKAEI